MTTDRPMASADRRDGVAAGVLFLVTEVAAVAGVLLYRPVLGSADYVLGAGADGRVLLGALCEVVLVLAVAGTGFMLFPVIRRQHEGLALGYVCVRLLEAAFILLGLVSLLAVVTLRRDVSAAHGEGAASYAAAARALVAVHDWTFLLGPNLILGVNTLLLAALVHRSGAVPRAITLLGMVGGPLITASAVAVQFGLYGQLSTAGKLAALPVFAWEVSFAVWLLARGFRGTAPAAVLPRPAQTHLRPGPRATAGLTD
ncbi:DUF4386 domain-containing protein [Kitasatospora sp. NPDC048538]|uniref:DUF4386 domain-containing protein n=1 Tax=unclassified Kitasatospora TaxID=2633591 RepID=UPI0033C248BA